MISRRTPGLASLAWMWAYNWLLLKARSVAANESSAVDSSSGSAAEQAANKITTPKNRTVTNLFTFPILLKMNKNFCLKG